MDNCEKSFLYNSLNNKATLENDNIQEIKTDFNDDLSDFWVSKLTSYDIDKYKEDIKKFGIEDTWKHICNYVLSNNFNNSFLNASCFSELYENALAIEDKGQKKVNGQYYTPNDVATIMSTWLKNLDATNICDVACGTGKLILNYLDLIGHNQAVKLLSEGKIYLYDIDKTALMICKTALMCIYGKKYEKSIHAIHCDFLNKNVHLPQNCKVISNPPYSIIKKIPETWTNSKIQIQTKELYACFIEKILLESDKSVIITPYSFIGGNKFYQLRLLMNNYSGFIISFDNVPGNIFSGKKHGVFNSNTSNSVRASITVVDNKNKGFRLSPLIRFKNIERKKLLNCNTLESTLSSKFQIVNKSNKMYRKCDKSLEEIYDCWIEKSEDVLENYISNKNSIYTIFIPNTCRYFTTASNYQLKRKGAIKLSFDNKETFNYVYCLFNSSFAYFWWRIFDGGITYPLGLILKIPVFVNMLSNKDKTFFNRTAESMIKVETQYLTKKKNAGTVQENIKFPTKFRTRLNKRFLKILGLNTNLYKNLNKIHKNKFF